MNYESKISIIINKFGRDFKKTDGEHKHFRYCCPFCDKKRGKSDSSYKLYVNVDPKEPYKVGKFYCFKCGSKGNAIGLLQESYSGVYDKLLKYCENEDVSDENESNIFYLPKIAIPKNSIAYEYCISRGLTDELIDYYDIRLGTDELFGRIVIPNEEYGNTGIWTDMYSSRTYIDQEPKYLNPPYSHKTSSVFNIHRINKGGDIYVNEGALTAIMAGKDAIATYGCHPSDAQIFSIVEKGAKNYYCTLDGDEAGRKPNVDLARKLSENVASGSNVYLVNMPEDKDAADMGEKLYKEYVMDNRILFYSSVYANLVSYVKN